MLFLSILRFSVTQVILKAKNGSLKAKNGCLLFKVIKGRFEAKNEHFNYKF